MKINYVKLTAVACLSVSALASPTGTPMSEGTLSKRTTWDPLGWWTNWWDWFRERDWANHPKRRRCRNPAIRKEWSAYTLNEKQQYIAAVKCLANKPSTSVEMPGAISRFDDFQGVHSAQTDDIHWVGHFIIWHRLFVAKYETALREECGWHGGQPYWDWIRDSESELEMDEYDIFSATTGLGGNGVYVEASPEDNFFNLNQTGGGCVPDGPFTEANGFSISLGPSTDLTISNPRCLTRDFVPDTFKQNVVRSAWDEILAQPDFGAFARRIEAITSFDMTNVHGGPHFGVGGVGGHLGNAYHSPGDPIFYFHHGNLDRLFWLWQLQDITTRLSDVSGPIIPFDYTNQAGANVTLDFKINLGEYTGDIKLSELMNIEGGELCYKYV